MGTTADKLNKLLETKADIKAAIKGKGQSVSDSDTFASYADKIGAIPTPADGSIPTKTASDMTASGATVTAPAGYYASAASKSVATATQATPSISVDSAGLITASATQTAGYVSAGTKSATKQLTTQAAKTITPSTSEQTAVASGVYTTGAVKVAAMPTATQATPSISVDSAGKITASATQTAGYVAAGTKTGTKQLTVQAAKTVTPGTSNQTAVAKNVYTTGAVTVAGDANLKAENIVPGKTIFGVAGAATPESIGAASENIGDIKATVRSDLGDKWLLCNGATVDPDVYPELAAICPRQELEAALIQVKTIWSATSTGCEINDVKYLNGYWVVAGMRYYNSYCQASFAYTTNLETGSWTTKDLWYDTFGSYLYTIDYINGYWVVGGSYGQSGQRTVYHGRIAYATSLSGTWTTVDLWNGTMSSNYVTSIAYGNGYWVAAGENYSGSGQSTIAYATSLDGTWTTKNLWGGNNNCGLNCLVYADGYWVTGGGTYFSDTNGNSSTYVPHARIAYATDPSGSWTIKDLWTSETKGTNGIDSAIECIAYANGYWVVGGGRGVDYTNTKAQIAYATSLSGTWTQVPVWSTSGGSADGWYTNVTDIVFEDGQWVVTGTAYVGSPDYITTYKVANSMDLDTWDVRDLGHYNGQDSFGSSITYHKPYFVVGRKTYDGTTYTGSIDYFPMGRVVPKADGDHYMYIKAKE